MCKIMLPKPYDFLSQGAWGSWGTWGSWGSWGLCGAWGGRLRIGYVAKRGGPTRTDCPPAALSAYANLTYYLTLTQRTKINALKTDFAHRVA